MDAGAMQNLFIFIVFFLVVSLILGLVYKLGMKEKSYEEALAEQRHSSQSLLGIKQKPKEKKSKKSTKKTKEKDPDDKKNDKAEVKNIIKTDILDTDVKQDSKPKLKFTKMPQKSSEDINSEGQIVHKEAAVDKPLVTKKIETVKVVLKEKTNAIKKDEQKKEKSTVKKEQMKKETIKEKSGNKREETKVKNDVLLKSDDQPFKEAEKEIEPVKKDDKHFVTATQVEEQTQETDADKIPNKSVKWNANQNKEKKEVEAAIVTKAPLTNGYIVNQTKDKKKKKNELNALQQLTAAPGGPGMALVLNMIHKAELSHADIQVLIDLLLNKQFDRTSVLDDWSEGKSDPVQKLKKQLAEKDKALLNEQETLAAVQIKLKEIRSEQLIERNALNQKIKALEEQLQNQQMEIHASNNRYHAQGQQLQQVQVQLNEERMKLHSLREELNAVQIQRQQLEIHIAQESEVMIAQLRADVQELSTRNEQLMMDLNNIMKEASSNVDQMNGMTQEICDKSRQVEDLCIELSNAKEMLYRQESDLKMQIAQSNAAMQQKDIELRKMEKDKEDQIEEINNLKKQKSISSKVITQLKSDIEKLQEEKSQNEASLENNKINQTEVLNLKNELASLKNQLEESEKKFKLEGENTLNLMSKLENELEEQKTKNNELRNKNYKIMEALNAAESRIQNGQLEIANKEKDASENRALEIESQKKFLTRLLPEVSDLGHIPTDQWEEECLKVVSNYLDSLRKPVGVDSTENLQARIEHYQNIIKNTEGMLGKLQAHVDQEEISWKAQIKSKDLELEALKEKLEKSQNLENINGSSVEGQ
ncbi:hypothetical protein WA026_017565 [Henosepilachna vigintioctopunctata]|uniref:Ribosome-binding protein 1 n=1 Tax=Henosepilachna vigintioctopunctata TaxID=420089 RepID=A0AAW1V0H1_9CUCU